MVPRSFLLKSKAKGLLFVAQTEGSEGAQMLNRCPGGLLRRTEVSTYCDILESSIQ